jgi:hypothetical protein
MPSTTNPVLGHELPPEVLAFAAEKGVTPYLGPMLELVRRIFPTAPFTVKVEEDPEIEDYRHIVFDVEVNGMDVSQIVAAEREWSSRVFQICPPDQALCFLLGTR